MELLQHRRSCSKVGSLSGHDFAVVNGVIGGFVCHLLLGDALSRAVGNSPISSHVISEASRAS
jgi:hypothetical protein